ncbi:LacI family DNA-binding transcriptional regulator [Dictyobacter arantiisoli]|uniref:LacI family transcriptional regulator n=1 Tax=Dictyobacter arantiisoli TaxID=2014874 RepID=A0A5A5T766_9CHLR|nr:LacI family DNA-binding transcriptional regulator [Dictyobacter arantiisoli]GCF07036.1 LacI family transcriptional regulator [Dictyobacter arantiisoli]
MAQIAQETGVSITTVSKVLNNMPGVGNQTRERIQKVVERYDYVQNHAARHLRKGQSGLIDLVLMRLEGGYDVGIMHGIQDALKQSGHRLVVFATNEDESTERLWLRRLLDQSTDGVLLLLPYEQVGITDALLAQHIPFVAIGDRNEPTTAFPTIGSTIWLGGYTATEYLISLGHRRIGIITGPLHLMTSRARLAAYREAHERAGIPVDPALICEGNYLLGDGIQQTHSLLDLSDPPTAIFTGNDAQATGVYQALYQRNISIPDGISVIGFDDVMYTAQMAPPLTTIRQPLMEMGKMATHMLLNLINGQPLDSNHIELSTSLVIRNSCARPRNGSL